MLTTIDLLQLTSGHRINDKVLLRNNQLKKIIEEFPSQQNFKNFEDLYSTVGMDNALYQQAFLQVVSETVCNYPSTYISEKTIKPILNKRPFVIVGPAGSLARLQSLGFKTFSDFWDETYDVIDSFEDRITAVVDIVETVCGYSIQELQSLCVKMEDVLNYNFNYCVNELKNIELQQFEQACIENLKPRYD
jgi:hypothetical protein